MASDRRWTGGIANREWVRGHAATREINRQQLTAGVAAYLADCRTHRDLLTAKYHPTEAGALKAVYHVGDAEAEFIRGAYAEACRRADGEPPAGEAREHG